MYSRTAVELIFDTRWGLLAFNVNHKSAQEALELLGMSLRERDPNVYWIPELQHHTFSEKVCELIDMITAELESAGVDWFLSEATEMVYLGRSTQRLAS